MNNKLRRLVAVGGALLVTVLLIVMMEQKPLHALHALFLGPIQNIGSFRPVIDKTIALTLTGLAFSVMLEAGVINLGSEGAFHLSALIVTAVATGASTFWKAPLILIGIGAFTGALVLFVPAFLERLTSANVVVTSLLMNYIVLYGCGYVLNYHLKDPLAGVIASEMIPVESKLSAIGPTHGGFLIATVSVLLLTLLMHHTRVGFSIRLVGQNPTLARHAGCSVGKYRILSQLIGGGLAGIGGAVELLGNYRRFTWIRFLGFGWDGIIVSVLAHKNPLFVPLSAFFLSYLRVGADMMSRQTSISPDMIAITQGIVILWIVANPKRPFINRRRTP